MNLILSKTASAGFMPITTTYFASEMARRNEITVRTDARFHPKHIEYPFRAEHRLLAHLLESPGAVVEAWSAAALYGFGSFSDGADACLLGGGRTAIATALTPRRRHLNDAIECFRRRWFELDVQIVTPEYALVSCLSGVFRGKHAWHLPRTSEPTFVRAVQLVDAYRRNYRLDDVTAAAKGRVDERFLRRVLRASDGGAESPRETVLRLLLAQVPGLKLTSQVPVYAGNRLVTRLDLADVDLKIAFMYDGAHHGGGDQWKKDAEITMELKRLGWRVIRVVSTLLDKPDYLLHVVSQVVARG